MSTYQQVIDRARLTLNDAAKVRYSDANAFEWAKDGCREIALIMPDQFVYTATLQCLAGVEQTIGTLPGALYLVDVLRVVSGNDVWETDYEANRRFSPGWRNEAAGPAEIWMRLPRDLDKRANDRFYVSPPSVLGQQLEVSVVGLDFSATTLASAVPIAHNYEPALEAYIVYRAEAIDDEHVNSGRAIAFKAEFEKLLGVGKATEAPKV